MLMQRLPALIFCALDNIMPSEVPLPTDPLVGKAEASVAEYSAPFPRLPESTGGVASAMMKMRDFGIDQMRARVKSETKRLSLDVAAQ